MRIRLSPLASDKIHIKKHIKLYFISSIISHTHTSFKVSFHKNYSSSLIVYESVLITKKQILQDNKQKCGIYKWINKINGKSYVGSSVNFSSRLSSYLYKNYLTKRASIYNSKIYNSKIYNSKTYNSKTYNSKIYNSKIYNTLLAYGYNNFRLEILDYCDISNVIKVEQDCIDKLKPEYNILTKAGSSLNFKHYKETLYKLKYHKLSAEALYNLKKKNLVLL
jgi:hypothetical protein